jgi:hypothetical protein
MAAWDRDTQGQHFTLEKFALRDDQVRGRQAFLQPPLQSGIGANEFAGQDIRPMRPHDQGEVQQALERRPDIGRGVGAMAALP